MDLHLPSTPYKLILTALTQIPIYHYISLLFFISIVFLYNFLDIHFFTDLFSGFRGQPIALTFCYGSELYEKVVSKCQILHGRYLSTPWLSSPHLQTAFFSFFARPLVFSYKRQLFILDDGGTIALDWLTHSDVSDDSVQVSNAPPKDDKTPTVVVVPGLTSDSDSVYMRQFVYKMAKCGWNVVVSNHRGLGGVSLTSDFCYNAGWTEDLRKVIGHIKCQNPEAPLFLVGCSMGANVVINYLGEDGIKTPIAGAAAVCCPWDILICDRFLNRKAIQQFYNKALVVGLKCYAQLHQAVVSRIVDWEGIDKCSVLRHFDHHVTRVAAKFETVDAYYRHCSSSNYVGDVMIPLLCINALDDPVCTCEAIPFDECRVNKNIVLATTQHGGHLAFYEGITGNSSWWVRAVHEFLVVLKSSTNFHGKQDAKIQNTYTGCPQNPSIVQGPYVNIVEDGIVTATGNDQITNSEDGGKEPLAHTEKEDIILATHKSDHFREEQDAKVTTVPLRRYMDQLLRHNRKSVWLLAYIAIMTTWPVVGAGIAFLWRKRFANRLRTLPKI